ncbi:FAD-binding protein [Acidianus sulfidivorans JP7]|uniref:FAD-linked oxidase n=1 Tax=Acidianus sulfidivorans JP7 TaxID=619593 RepID=A0A2U9ILI5_9CREN|nr:FAD-binding oxidoreductase [Acidianus sulfidivorans]AWR96855.1 FAD-binding protein [Acidianus sulfidivorans JP7]
MSQLLMFEKEFGKNFTLDEKELEKASEDHYLVSPIIKSLSKKAIGLIKINNEEDIKAAIKIAYNYNIPLVARGAGTSTIGQVILLKPSVVLDFNNMKGIDYFDDNYISVKPGTKVLEILNYLRKRGKDLMVYPSSFYISTIGGYVAGGDVGIGSFQYGYYFDKSLIKLEVIGFDRKEEFKGKDVWGFAQAAGTTGFIINSTFKLTQFEDWKDYIIESDDLLSLLETIKNLDRKKVRRVVIEDQDAFFTVAKGRVNSSKKWICIISSTVPFGSEVNLNFMDELAFAAVYVTMSKISPFKNYFYEVRLFPLDKFLSIVTKVKKILGNKVLIHGDVMTLNGEIIIYTVFMSDKENFEVIDEIMKSEGIPFEIHSIEVNDRVDNPERLFLMKKYKLLMDPKDLINPGKLRI